MATSLPAPIELCLEELDDLSSTEPYVRCVAVAGGTPGLCFSAKGEVLWRLNDAALAELWVSRDGQLILFRKKPEGTVSLTRGERHLELPLGKPVVVLDGDAANIEGKRYRIYVHGTTDSVVPPERLNLRRARNLVVGAAITVSALAAGCKSSPGTNASDGAVSPTSTMAVSSSAPTVTPIVDAGTVQTAEVATGGAAGVVEGTGGRSAKKPPPIRIIPRPPAPVARPQEPAEPLPPALRKNLK